MLCFRMIEECWKDAAGTVSMVARLKRRKEEIRRQLEEQELERMKLYDKNVRLPRRCFLSLPDKNIL